MSGRTLTASGLADRDERRVLMARRDTSWRDFLAFLLEDDGWSVQTAESLALAQMEYGLEGADILIWDVDLVDAGPQVLLDMLRADPATAALPVLFLTLRAGDLEAGWAQERRVTVMQMPFEIDDLIAEMRRLLG